MRIRNRPTPSIFPPPPDLNLNRSFPRPQPAQVQPRPLDAAAASDHHHNHSPSLHRTTHPLPTSISYDRSPDQIPLAAYALRRSGKVSAKKSSRAAGASSDSDDNDDDIIIPRKGSSVDDSGVQLFSNATVEEREKARLIQTADAKDNGKNVKGMVAKEVSVGKGVTVKTSSRNSAGFMEGSRCSRVNGRGWRCGQQTLVGYSLCEHHLGKSRLRSLTSMKNNNTTSSVKDDYAVAALGSSKRERLINEDSDSDDEALLMSGRKKSRIGTVKARSLSSLLGQTNKINGVSQSDMSK